MEKALGLKGKPLNRVNIKYDCPIRALLFRTMLASATCIYLADRNKGTNIYPEERCLLASSLILKSFEI